jgi:predicted PurR-regulated permease PerM
MVLGRMVSLEFTISMFLEPLLYGQSAGVSEVALLVAIAFWTWLWGPIGLLLATAAHGPFGRARQIRATTRIHRDSHG